MKISKKHPNRRPHNWLIYDINDRWLEKHKHMYGSTIYDLGCGESPYKEWFLNFADSYIGVDWSDSFHDLNSDIQTDLNKALPIENEVADTVISISVIEHLHNPQSMLNEAFRILKPEGTFIAQVPWQWGVHEAPFDFYRYTPYALRRILSSAGFVDINIEAQSGCFTMLAMKINYLSSRLLRGPKIIKGIIKLPLYLVWYITQKLAPYLDKLDGNWDLETSTFFITAKKKFY